MFDMVKTSIILFFQGRLYAEPGLVYRQLAIGVVVTIAVLLGLVFARVGLPIAAGAAGFIGGLLQPYLFKDLRFR